MHESQRQTAARVAAHKTAPRPFHSSSIYGVVAASVFVVGILALGQFYGFRPLLYPLALGIGALAVFGLGVLLRRWRHRLHTSAYETEYKQRGE